MKTAGYTTSIGPVWITEENGGIIGVHLKTLPPSPDGERGETDLLREAFRQLIAYLSGNLQEFSLPLAPRGTDFQRKVWDILCRVPYGKTASYKDVAIALGRPGASRAVGQANGKNPIPILIPCHRIIGADGSLGGYSSGVDIKGKLLEIETRHHA